LTGTGLLLLTSETVLPDWEVKVAPVMLNWKNKTVTPAGGVSVTVRLTGAVCAAEVLVVVGVVEDWLPQPVMNRRNAKTKRNIAALRIPASYAE
jgi:hypothetical protein